MDGHKEEKMKSKKNKKKKRMKEGGEKNSKSILNANRQQLNEKTEQSVSFCLDSSHLKGC